METRAEDGDGAAVAVERRVGDKLVVERGAYGFPEGDVVIRFEDFLESIGQGAVPRENAGASRGEKVAVDAGEAGCGV